MKKVAVTGAAGRVSYNLLFKIARGELFGEEKLELNLIDVETNAQTLEGVALELEDSASKNISKIRYGFDLNLFDGVNYAFLIGSLPRKQGMERQDLLLKNGEIFVKQGKALDKFAARDVKVLVVGNPCNTNCLICLKNAPSLSPLQFCAMTRLDQNRAHFQIAKAKDLPLEEVSNVIIWGNHSSTQVIDLCNVKIKGSSPSNTEELQKVIPIVKERGLEIIKKLGASSAGSSATAAIDTMRSWDSSEAIPSSVGVYSTGNPYGIDQDLCFSFPSKPKGNEWQIVPDYKVDDSLKKELLLTEEELKKERSMVAKFIEGQ